MPRLVFHAAQKSTPFLHCCCAVASSLHTHFDITHTPFHTPTHNGVVTVSLRYCSELTDRLGVCISGVYGAFLLWAIAQERRELEGKSELTAVSKPFPSRGPHPTLDKFPSPLFFNFCQAITSATCAAVYLLVKAWSAGSKEGVLSILGVTRLVDGIKEVIEANRPKSGSTTPEFTSEDEKQAVLANGNGNGNGVTKKSLANGAAAQRPWYQSLPALLLQVSIFQTTAGPIGFLALRHISYPMMVLGKVSCDNTSEANVQSCKLIPVLLLNVLLYRRRFGRQKYVVVGLVTLGISLFMLNGNKKGGGENSAYGLLLLLVNLLIDGLTNSTQDQLFALYPGYSGQQMMFIMASITMCVLSLPMLIPMPAAPLMASGHGLVSAFTAPVALRSLHFLATHPSALAPLAAYAALGGLGQIFIFETISHFGSLTLVMVTVTRKLFTMLLSVFVFGHKLSLGQWAGVAVVFAGIGVEAGWKRREAMKRAKRD